ncbi:shikimate kinase, chloroplastic-like [Andrographis paniculata]|uniref:shikimate kinase, chloroplastic-like n=1 Tax=Andrographis paniculata TaxID=175694 RepID=UPI0021E845E3|nr:shikimate kinase, chloroplastic-like [Andrographis paniculata]
MNERWKHRMASSCHLLNRRGRYSRPLVLKVSSSSDFSPASVLDPGNSTTSLDESKTLKNKAEDVGQHLNGKCIYLVGMMGSGKTTVGKVLAEALGYSFCDCDTLIEEAVGGSSVAEIFKLHGENFFRDNETEVIQKLSLMHQLIISTGGGAVVRPINWKHMRKGISVWLDVSLELLAQRITAVGTDSRPLLQHGSGDPYSKTLKLLSSLFEKRGGAYASADVRVSLENIAAKLGSTDVCELTPTLIAIEVLQQVANYLKKQGG